VPVDEILGFFNMLKMPGSSNKEKPDKKTTASPISCGPVFAMQMA
jgi:hypothetical protein